MKRIAPEIESAIVESWQAGERSTSKLAAAHGIGDSTVRSCIERNGLGRVFRASYPRKTTPEQDAEIVRLYQEGYSAPRIGAMYEIHPGSIRTRVREAGNQPRSKGERPLTPEETAEVLRLRVDGHGVVEIGKSLGIGYTRVRRCLRDNGFPTWSLVRRKKLVYGNPDGYVFFYAIDPEDPLAVMANSRGYILHHRYVMAQSLGRPLDKSETVHHVNGDRHDNRLENLQLRQGRHGKGASFTCLDCGSHNVSAASL